MTQATTATPSWSQPVTRLNGVGPALAEKLARIGIRQIIDLLFHLPLRYEDRTRVHPIGSAAVGARIVVEGTIELTDVVFRGRRALIVHVSDGTGVLALRFFYFSMAQKSALVRGARIRCFGEVRHGASQREMIHPEYRLIKEGDSARPDETLTPVYPVTEGVQQGRLRLLIDRALSATQTDSLPDWLPPELLQQLDYPQIGTALQMVHKPTPATNIEQLNAGTHPCQRRLALDELIAHHLSLKLLRRRLQEDPGMALPGTGQLTPKFLKALPFTLTPAQQRVIGEIMTDLESTRPMLRLLQGDVGSGKTVVAAAVATRAIECGTQVAVMAPTELLAEQHLRSFGEWLTPLGVAVVGLASKMPAREKREALAKIASGEAAVAVGTHALFQQQVEFDHLSLAIVDEQHRFGVHQRLLLKAKGRDNLVPHQLVMTATPIPRTLSMSAYADLDCSILDTLPPGRKPVQTVVMNDSRRADIVARIASTCGDGQQAYWVCPLVSESEHLECEAAQNTAVQLQDALPGLRIGLIHGQLSAQEKAGAMADFASGKTDLLVATTVIEVGVDVPNASLMIIENAERMGLAQLHQLRGRIGRGTRQSVCVLLYKPPLKGHARRRLKVIRESTDGFEIAEQDLRLRGPGEVLGTRQTGRLQMKIADIVRDADLLPFVQRASLMLFERYPDHIEPLVHRWIAEQGRYGGV